MDNQDSANKSRRQAVRSSDRILLSCDKIAPAAFEQIAEDFRHGISFYNQTGLAEVQMYVAAQSSLAKLRERDEDLAVFLQHLDSKVNVLLQKILNKNSPFEALQLHKVDLSATGIAFLASQSFDKGQIVALHMALLPGYIYIFCYGNVVGCQPESNREGVSLYRISVEFTLITEDDREKLIQHNFRQQSLALRNRRLNV